LFTGACALPLVGPGRGDSTHFWHPDVRPGTVRSQWVEGRANPHPGGEYGRVAGADRVRYSSLRTRQATFAGGLNDFHGRD